MLATTVRRSTGDKKQMLKHKCSDALYFPMLLDGVGIRGFNEAESFETVEMGLSSTCSIYVSTEMKGT